MRFRLSLFLALATVSMVATAKTVARDHQLNSALEALARGDGLAAQMALTLARKNGVAEGELRPLLARAALLQGEIGKTTSLIGNDERDAHILGLAALRQGDVAKARALIEAAVAQDAKDPAKWIALARLQIASADRDSANAALETALKLSPENAEALVLKGNLVRDSQGLLPALNWYDRALKQTPGRLDALFEKAATLGDMGRATQSLAVTRDLLRWSPNNAQAFYLQAVIAARAGNFDLSRRLMFRVGPRLDAQPGAILVSAVAELQGGNYDGAAKRLRNLLLMQPNNARVRRLLGLGLWKQGQMKDAVFTLGPIADRGDGYALMIIGRAYEVIGDRAAAATALDRAARAQATQPTVEAMAKLDGFVANNPGNIWALRASADRALSLGDVQGSASLYAALQSRLGDGDPIRMVNTAWANVLAGGDGLEQAGQAYARAPMNPLVTATYGAVLRRDGNISRATALLEKAVALAPSETRVLAELAAARAQTQQ